jgi:hypothetical protein
MEILRAKGYLPYSMGKIVPVRLSPDEIKVYVGISRQNPKFFSDDIIRNPSCPELEVRAMTIFLQKYRKEHLLQLVLTMDKEDNKIAMTALMIDREYFGNRPRYFGRMDSEDLFQLTPKKHVPQEVWKIFLTAPMEDLYFMACKQQPEFVDIFNSFLALPSTEEN